MASRVVMKPAPRTASSPNGWAWAGLALYAGAWAALSVAGFRPTAPDSFSVPDNPRAAVESLLGLATSGLLEIARFVPLGMLTVLGLGTRDRWLRRLVFVAAPALALAIALAVVLRAVELGRPWSWPGITDVFLPAVGCVLGTWIGLAWVRGPRARRWIVPKVFALALLGVASTLVLAYYAAESDALPFEPARVTSEEKRRLRALFKGKNPKTIPAGETRTLRLTERDLDLLLAWAVPLSGERRKAGVELGPDASALQVSMGVPTGRASAVYLNLTVRGRVGVHDGRLGLRWQQLRLGQVEVPQWLLRAVSPLLAAALRTDRRVRPILASVRDLEISPQELTATYGRAELPAGFLGSVLQGENAGADLTASVRTYVQAILHSAQGVPAPSRLGIAAQTAFALARQRSGAASAVQENQSALLALGMLLGHWRLESFVGPVMDEPTRRSAGKTFHDVAIRGREDWTKHFFVSAGLAALSTEAVSDAAGLFKEELDADGGSGFSFGDLLADRAGTAFAGAATRDDEAARAMQRRVSLSFRLDDFFPSAEGLPEGLTDAELQARYGGVGGKGYQRLVAEIERRVAGCPAYRQ